MLKGLCCSAQTGERSPLRPEVFNNGKPCETIAECGGEFSVPFETLLSTACSLLPVKREAISGSTVSPAAIAVMSSEYLHISSSAPMKVTALVIIASICAR